MVDGVPLGIVQARPPRPPCCRSGGTQHVRGGGRVWVHVILRSIECVSEERHDRDIWGRIPFPVWINFSTLSLPSKLQAPVSPAPGTSWSGKHPGMPALPPPPARPPPPASCREMRTTGSGGRTGGPPWQSPSLGGCGSETGAASAEPVASELRTWPPHYPVLQVSMLTSMIMLIWIRGKPDRASIARMQT